MQSPADKSELKKMLSEFETCKFALQDKRISQFDELLRSFTNICGTKTPTSPNIFSLLGASRNELAHSSMIRWLLDRQSSHGLGSIFLEKLCALIQFSPPDHSLDSYIVRKEFSRPQSRIDILVYSNNGFIIFIENKIDDLEGPKQLERELSDLERTSKALRIAPQYQVALFLTADGRKPVGAKCKSWKTISYSQLSTVFSPLIDSIVDDKSRHLLSDWLDTVKIFGGSNAGIIRS